MKQSPIFRYRNEEIPIKIVRSRRKSITLSVSHTGEISIKAPTFVLNRELDSFIENQANWIHSKISHQRDNCKKFTLEYGHSILLLGRERVIEKSETYLITYNEKTIFIPETVIYEKDRLISWYKDIAREIITNKVNIYRDKLGIEYNKIYIKSQKTRWGSCSTKKNLNFNWKVILAPIELIEYLVIHEVCHLIHMNHGVEFWRLVKSLDPNCIKNRNELQKYGYLLTSFLE